MKGKKENNKKQGSKVNSGATSPIVGEINTESDLKAFLLNVRDKMAEESAPPVFAFTVMNQILTTPDISNLLNNENKEIARDIWLRVKQAGFQARNPVLLFGTEENQDAANTNR